jgi:hypothetical protein
MDGNDGKPAPSWPNPVLTKGEAVGAAVRLNESIEEEWEMPPEEKGDEFTFENPKGELKLASSGGEAVDGREPNAEE